MVKFEGPRAVDGEYLYCCTSGFDWFVTVIILIDFLSETVAPLSVLKIHHYPKLQVMKIPSATRIWG